MIARTGSIICVLLMFGLIFPTKTFSQENLGENSPAATILGLMKLFRSSDDYGCEEKCGNPTCCIAFFPQTHNIEANFGDIKEALGAPIKIWGFIFTHASGCVPRHAVLGVGVSNEVRARQRPRAMRALARAGSGAA